MRNSEFVQSTADGQRLLVSVVIVTHNGRRFIDACLASVLDQDFPLEQYEIIVVDNASKDGTPEFVDQNYPSVRILRFEHNYGPNEAFNRVVPHLNGKYFAYLNQDIVAHRRWLSELVEVITANPQAGIVESNMILPEWPEYEGVKDRDGLVRRAYVCDITSYGTHDFRVAQVTLETQPFKVLAVYGAGCIINPKIIEQLGYWLDPNFFAYADDLDLGLRLNAAGFEVLLAPRSVVFHDTDWHIKWDMRSLRRAFWVTRNTILAFYKISYMSEFKVILPRLLIGKLLKAGQHCQSKAGKMFYALAGLPLLLLGLVAALWRMPTFAKQRKLTLEKRQMAEGWLINRLLGRKWQPDQNVWIKEVRSVETMSLD